MRVECLCIQTSSNSPFIYCYSIPCAFDFDTHQKNKINFSHESTRSCCDFSLIDTRLQSLFLSQSLVRVSILRNWPTTQDAHMFVFASLWVFGVSRQTHRFQFFMMELYYVRVCMSRVQCCNCNCNCSRINRRRRHFASFVSAFTSYGSATSLDGLGGCAKNRFSCSHTHTQKPPLGPETNKYLCMVCRHRRLRCISRKICLFHRLCVIPNDRMDYFYLLYQLLASTQPTAICTHNYYILPTINEKCLLFVRNSGFVYFHVFFLAIAIAIAFCFYAI